GQRDDLIAPACGRPAFRRPIAQDTDTHALVANQTHEAQGGGHAQRVVELGRRAELHRGGRVGEHVQAKVFFVDEELDVQTIEPTVDVPVDVSQVVADAVGPIVGELHG